MQTVLITGGSGMIGTQLTKHLTARGYQVIILTRKIESTKPAEALVTYALWNTARQTIDPNAIKKADYIVNLAGAGVIEKKWTKAYKQEIIRSRTDSGALLVQGLQENAHSVKAVVSASAIGFYGEDSSPGSHGFIESNEASPEFLGEACKAWEESIEPVVNLRIRLVKMRIGIVLSNEGGALPEFKKPLRFGVAGILGSGKQVVSWIHIDDLCRIFIEAIENQQLAGPYNAVAPAPVSNKVLTLELAKKIKGSFYIPMHVPEFLLRLVLGQRSMEVLKSATVSSEKIRKAGFTFLYPSIEAALLQLCKK